MSVGRIVLINGSQAYVACKLNPLLKNAKKTFAFKVSTNYLNSSWEIDSNFFLFGFRNKHFKSEIWRTN